MTLPDRIRHALAPAHAAVEQTPFARAMSAGRLGRAEYAAGLRRLGHLHAALEAALAAASGDAAVAALYDPTRMARTATIRRDLAALGAGTADAPAEPLVRLSHSFDRWAAERPWALLGPLYVTEGSRMGSMALCQSLGRAFGVDPRRPGSGLEYHTDGLATRPGDWKQFRQALAELPLTEDRESDICRAATSTMDELIELYSGLPVPTAEPQAAIV